MAAERATNIGVPDGVYKDLRAFCDRRRLVLKDVAGDVLRWFLSQPELVRSVVLDVVDEGMAASYAATLRKMADEVEKSATKPSRPRVMVADPGAKPSRPPQPGETRPGEHNSRRNAQ